MSNSGGAHCFTPRPKMVQEPWSGHGKEATRFHPEGWERILLEIFHHTVFSSTGVMRQSSIN